MVNVREGQVTPCDEQSFGNFYLLWTITWLSMREWNLRVLFIKCCSCTSCVFLVLITFWHHLWSKTEQTHWAMWNLFINPLTPKISLVILLTVCHTVLVMLVWRIWDWINLKSPNWYFSLFSSLVCLILHWYCREKLCRGHSWELKGWLHVPY